MKRNKILFWIVFFSIALTISFMISKKMETQQTLSKETFEEMEARYAIRAEKNRQALLKRCTTAFHDSFSKKITDYPDTMERRGLEETGDEIPTKEELGSCIFAAFNDRFGEEGKTQATQAFQNWFPDILPYTTFYISNNDEYGTPELDALVMPYLRELAQRGPGYKEPAQLDDLRIFNKNAYRYIVSLQDSEMDASLFRQALQYKEAGMRENSKYGRMQSYLRRYEYILSALKKSPQTMDGKLVEEMVRMNDLYPSLDTEWYGDPAFLERMDFDPPAMDTILRLYCLGCSSNKGFNKAMKYYPDTALTRHFAAMDISMAGQFPDAGELMSTYGYNTFEFGNIYSLIKITPELRNTMEQKANPKKAESYKEVVLEAKDDYTTIRLTRSLALAYCNLPDTWPWLKSTYYLLKKEKRGERIQAEILSSLNHTDIFPASEYVERALDPQSSRIMKFAAAGALYTITDIPTEEQLLLLYNTYRKNPEDDLLLANIVIAMRRLPDTPKREAVFKEIMENLEIPFTRRQVRIIRYGKDMEEFFHAGDRGGRSQSPEMARFLFAINSGFADDLYELSLKNKDDILLSMAVERLGNTAVYPIKSSKLAKEYAPILCPLYAKLLTLLENSKDFPLTRVAIRTELDYSANALKAFCPILEPWGGVHKTWPPHYDHEMEGFHRGVKGLDPNWDAAH